MNFKTILKSSVAAAALFAVAAPVSTTAIAADDSFSTGQATKLTMSGFVTRSIWHGDDGNSSRTFFADAAGGGGARIRWVASGTLSDSITAGATLELDLPKTQESDTAKLSSSALGDGGTEPAAAATWAVRHEYLWVSHKQMGKLSLGNTSTATDGMGGSSGRLFGRAIAFVNTTSATRTLSSNQVGTVFGDINGGRGNTLRYDTPSFGGFGASISKLSDGQWGAGLKYSGKFGALAVSANAGYDKVSESSDDSKNFNAMGMVSVTHDSGLSVKFGAGKTNYSGTASKTTAGGKGGIDSNNLGGRDDKHYYSLDVGYKAATMVGVGATSFSAGWQNSLNFSENDGDAVSFIIKISQSFDALGASIALSYQNFSYDAEGEVTVGTIVNEDYDDIDVLALQTTFNF